MGMEEGVISALVGLLGVPYNSRWWNTTNGNHYFKGYRTCFELLNKHLHVQYMLQFPIIMCWMLQSLMPRFGYSMESNLLLFFLQKSPLAEESRARSLHTATETLEVNLPERPGLCQIFSLAT